MKELRKTLNKIEWPTLCLIIGNYILFFVSVHYWQGLFIAKVGLVFSLILYNSLQHECIHGHPFPRAWRIFKYPLNDLVVFAPLNLVVNYSFYKKDHLLHHAADDLTHPERDPESYFQRSQDYEKLGLLRKVYLNLFNTIWGRMLFGPLKITLDILKRLFLRSQPLFLIVHFVLLGTLYWGILQDHLSLWQYAFYGVYPALSLSLIRSFTEHRPSETKNHSSAIVESNFLWQLLFLNNNFHIVHHKHPRMPWYLVKNSYMRNKSFWIKMNGNYHYPGYRSVFLSKEFLLPRKLIRK